MTSADYSRWTGTAYGAVANFDVTNVTYDLSGNLITQNRNRQDGTPIDQLSYTTPGTSNRLSSITDATATMTETWDAESGSFTYDPNGSILTSRAPYSITATTNAAEYYALDGSSTIGLFTETGSLTHWNIAAGGRVVGRHQGTMTHRRTCNAPVKKM